MGYDAEGWSQVPPATPVMDENDFVRDVREAFDRLRLRGDYITAWDGGVFPNHRYTGENYGDARGLIHFQGIQRLRTGRHLVLSGGDKLHPASHIFVIQLGSVTANPTGPLGSNIMRSRDPDVADRVIHVVGLTRDRWHAGGIYLLGDILAVPLEAGGNLDGTGHPILAKIVFLHLSDPTAPRLFPFEIPRTTTQAGAVTLIKLPNDHFLCAVWQDGKGNETGWLDFYLTLAPGLGPFGPVCATWKYPSGQPGERCNPRYQSISFVQELPRGGTQGSWLYLIGTANTDVMAPSIPGHDVADLFALRLPAAMLQSPVPQPLGPLPAPSVTWLSRRRFEGSDEHCNFAAAGGVHVDPHGILSLYGGFHWRISGTIRLTEFRSEEPAITGSEHEWVDLFEDVNFNGRRLSVLRGRAPDIPNYDKVLVQGKGFGDRTSSIRYQLVPGTTYRLYRDTGFTPADPSRCLDLRGTGRVVEIPNICKLRPDFGDCISSSRFV